MEKNIKDSRLYPFIQWRIFSWLVINWLQLNRSSPDWAEMSVTAFLPVISWIMLGVLQKRLGKQASNSKRWTVPMKTWNIFSRKASDRWLFSLHWTEDNFQKLFQKITRYQEANAVTWSEFWINHSMGGGASSLGYDKFLLSSFRHCVLRASL